MKMNDLDKNIWDILQLLDVDLFTIDWILLKYNKNYFNKTTEELIKSSLMKFFINGLIEPLNQSLDEWQLTKAGKFVKDNLL